MRIPVVGLLATLGAVTLTAQQAPAPQPPIDTPPATFRVEVNYVEVDAAVIDAQGKPVTDLTIDDFEVREDGRPQKVSAFSTINLPVERPERPLFAEAPVEPDVQTNTAAEGRVYMVVLDDLHTAFTNTPRVKQALRTFFQEHFGSNDLAAVVYTSGRATAGQEFTNNTRLLLAAVDRFSGRNLRSEALEIADSLNRSSDPATDAQTRLADPFEFERASQARTTLDAVRKLAEFMESIRGRRKTILLVSEGISYDVNDVFANRSASAIMGQAADAVAAATRANVSIYAIDPRGLDAFGEAIEISGTPDTTPQFSAVGRLRNSLRLSQDSLRVLASETGGFAAVDRNDLSGAFARIVRENSTYYVLGYYPSNDRRDGRFRRLEVRVTRPGLQVRARRGYVAPRGRAPGAKPAASADPLSAAATGALNSPIPLGGIPLSVFAAAYKGAAPNAAVALALEMRADDFRFAEKDGVFHDRLEVGFSSVDAAGTVRPGDRHTVTLDLKPDTLAATRERGFRLVSEIALPPGRYQLRAAVAEQGATRSGAVLYDLEVPDFHATGFSMSGVSLTSVATAAMPTVRAKDPLPNVLPGPPATTREFDRRDRLALFAEFYENMPGAPTHVVDLAATVRAADGRAVFEHREERSSADLQGASGGYGFGLQIPLGDIEPGTYVIRVEGRSRAGSGAAVGRDVLIRIRP